MVEYSLSVLLEKAVDHIGRHQMENALTSGDVDTIVEECLDVLPRSRLWAPGLNETQVKAAIRKHLQENISIEASKGEIIHRKDGGDWVQWLQDGERLDGRLIEWTWWGAYEQYLRTKRDPLPQKVVNALKESTMGTLARLVDPWQEGNWKCKGLVFGNVQSGKTGHYTGLISRALDAGYKNIIVLAGLTNDLRFQTQERLDEELVGRDTAPETGPDPIGVGVIRPTDIKIHTWTYADRGKGDFSATRRNHIAAQLGLDDLERPKLAVIKKNRAALDNVSVLLRDILEGHPRIRSLPTLVIDDECDQASIDASTGDPEDPRKAISQVNYSIRQLLQVFPKVTYVGYTATPFANVFIYPDAFSAEVGADLYPEDFVVALDPPENYMGPTQVFGSDFGIDPEKAEGPTWGVARKVTDHADFVTNLKKGGTPGARPRSLEDAVMSFALSTHLRRTRHERDQKSGLVHCGMLVQAIHLKRGHSEIRDILAEILEDLRHDLRDGPSSPLGRRLAELYVKEYLGGAARKEFPENWLPANVTDGDTWRALIGIVTSMEVKIINSDSEQVLEYRKATPPTIAVGGDKLSRGFTIEGLLVTYFLRSTLTEDTLLQMGRWFGYRSGWQDLVRTYLPQDMIRSFQKSAKSMEELRATFHQLNTEGRTPRDWAARVFLHPDTPDLWPTTLAKRRHAAVVRQGLEGSRIETTHFDTSTATIEHNKREFPCVVQALATRGTVMETGREVLIHGLTPDDLDLFFRSKLRFHPSNPPSVHRELLREYVRIKNDIGELTNWTVALPYNNRESPLAITALEGKRFGPRRRSVGKKGSQDANRVRISVFSESSDVEYGVPEAILVKARAHARAHTVGDGARDSSYQYIMKDRPITKGVLILSFVEPEDDWNSGQGQPHLGFIVVLPGSVRRDARDYLITTKALKGVEEDDEDE